MRRGLLLTITEPPPAMEEEFNAWYDDEHLPERLAIPGFRSAQRWVADLAPGEGRYLATYELDSPEVLTSAAYLARFKNATPWTRRCLGKAVVFKRWACAQTAPGAADPHAAAKALLLLTGDAPVAAPAGPAALQSRQFVASDGKPAHVVLVEFASIPATSAGRVYRAYGA